MSPRRALEIGAGGSAGSAGTVRDLGSLGGLGERIREIRKQRKLSLVAVSAASGVSVGMLSHIELGKATPSLKALEKLRTALGASMVDLFPSGAAAGGTTHRCVMRPDERRSLHFPEIGLTKERLSPGAKSDLEMLLLVIEPGGGSGPEPWTRPGEKAGLVLAGAATLAIGEEVFEIRTGDSFQFDASRPHSFQCIGDEPAQVLWIIKSLPIPNAVDA